jgi:hypothetical protein
VDYKEETEIFLKTCFKTLYLRKHQSLTPLGKSLRNSVSPVSQGFLMVGKGLEVLTHLFPTVLAKRCFWGPLLFDTSWLSHGWTKYFSYQRKSSGFETEVISHAGKY